MPGRFWQLADHCGITQMMWTSRTVYACSSQSMVCGRAHGGPTSSGHRTQRWFRSRRAKSSKTPGFQAGSQRIDQTITLSDADDFASGAITTFFDTGGQKYLCPAKIEGNAIPLRIYHGSLSRRLNGRPLRRRMLGHIQWRIWREPTSSTTNP